MGLLNDVLGGGGIDALTGKSSSSAAADLRTLEVDDFDKQFPNLEQGEYVDIAVYTVPAQTAYNVGFGSADTDRTVGTFFADLIDTGSNNVNAQIRVVTRNANDKNVDTEISGATTARLRNGENDPRKRLAVPEIMDTPKVGEDSKIVIQAKANSSSPADIDFSASTLELDTSEY